MQLKKENKILKTSYFAWFILVFILGACSTEKNTFINRSYHSVTARYNGYFNAKELIRIGLEDYRINANEDYTHILPIDLMPTKEDVVEFYPVLDTAIEKCKTVITKHSMPTASKPSQKKSEHARWIDKNWLLIGYANYMRMDYQQSYKNSKYVREFFTDKPSSYIGHLWEVRSLLALNEGAKATREMQKLDARLALLNSPKSEQKKSRNTRSKKGKKDKSDKTPKLPKNFKFELAKTRAMMAIEKEDYSKATQELQFALSKAKKKTDKARLNFIIGQLLQKQDYPEARKYYSAAIKKNAPFAMSFNAKINRALIGDMGADRKISELKKLAKEDRYLEYRDQIYFAMAEVELERPDRTMAKYNLTKSAFYSLNNPLQKGISYEKLGDLSLEDRNYIFAQKYYDSSAQVIPDSYVNAELIERKARELSKLVENIEIAEYEDSVQRIAKMDDKQRESYIKDIIKQLKKEEQERREREALKAEQMRQLQQTFTSKSSKSGNRFYFSNEKSMREGIDDFKRIWGQRENTDYWRLSNKPTFASFSDIDIDSLDVDSLNMDLAVADNKKLLDDLTVDDLLENIPLSDSAMALSNERMIGALYKSGLIYQEQLKEDELAATQFKKVINQKIENENNVKSAFQLFKIYENTSEATIYKNYILDNYPDSDYANYLNDPDYFIKKKEKDALALKDYLRSVTHYEQGLFYPIILKADQVIQNEPDNVFRAEYLLLKAMAMGRLNNDKTSLLPVLQTAVDDYPNTEIANRAQEMIDLINKGVPLFEEKPEENLDDLFSKEGEKYFVILILNDVIQTGPATTKISNFNRTYFSRLALKTSTKMYNKELGMVMVESFNSQGEASEYIEDFKKAKKIVDDLKTNEILFVSEDNYKTLMKDQAIEKYKKFYEINYQ